MDNLADDVAGTGLVHVQDEDEILDQVADGVQPCLEGGGLSLEIVRIVYPTRGGAFCEERRQFVMAVTKHHYDVVASPLGECSDLVLQ